MSMKYMTAALLASSFLTVPAFAQSVQQPVTATTASAAIQMQEAETWRTSKLIGLNVYNNSNEKIGDINEVITEPSGRVDIIVIGVGGFLGIGERNVGLPWNQVKFVMEPRPVTTGSTSMTTTTTTGAGTSAATTTTIAKTNRAYPDHAVSNMTKEQLEALPAFTYLSNVSSTTTRTTPAPAPAR
jgi:sporulation protein YlmC with PRC-barrel domain